MIEEILLAFGMIFFAEMGDKSQMLAMAFATKYKIKYVIMGMLIGILLNHILAVFLGQLIGEMIPLRLVSLSAGVLFLLFGFWSLSINEETNDEKVVNYGPIIAVSIAFFIGELGDKTQLVTFTLASDASYPLLILIGTVSGMMLVGLLGIYVGMKMGAKIPEELMKLLSGFVFVLFGLFKLYQYTPQAYKIFPYTFLFMLMIGILFALRAIPLVNLYKAHTSTPFKKTAEKLRVFYGELYGKLEGICLGENVCGGCDGKSCLVGYTKRMLKNAKEFKTVDLDYVKDVDHNKMFPKDKLIESLLLVLKSIEQDDFTSEIEVLTQLRYNYERLLIKHRIQDFDSRDTYIHQMAHYDKSIAKQLRLNWV